MSEEIIQPGYKVTSDNLKSCIVSVYGVQYEVDEWVKPHDECGPLCVFVLEEDARSFASSRDRIWECEYEPSLDIGVWIPINSNGTMCRCLPIKLSNGTVLANKVKLIKELPNHKVW